VLLSWSPSRGSSHFAFLSHEPIDRARIWLASRTPRKVGFGRRFADTLYSVSRNASSALRAFVERRKAIRALRARISNYGYRLLDRPGSSAAKERWHGGVQVPPRRPLPDGGGPQQHGRSAVRRSRAFRIRQLTRENFVVWVDSMSTGPMLMRESALPRRRNAR